MSKKATAKKPQHRTVTGEQKRDELAARREARESGFAPPGDGWEENGGNFAPLAGFVRVAEGVQVHGILKGVVERQQFPFLTFELCSPAMLEDRDAGTVSGAVGDVAGISYSACLKRIVEKGIGVEFWILFGGKVTTKAGNEAWTLAKSFVRGKGTPVPKQAPEPQSSDDNDEIPF